MGIGPGLEDRKFRLTLCTIRCAELGALSATTPWKSAAATNSATKVARTAVRENIASGRLR